MRPGLKVEQKNILEVRSGIIAHQVHIQHPNGKRPGTFGKGLAAQIRLSYPIVFERYKAYAEIWELGKIQIVSVTSELAIASLAAQLTYGRGLETDYNALSVCLNKLQKAADQKQVYLPHGLGCGNAGGDWKIVSEIIADFCPSAIICNLP